MTLDAGACPPAAEAALDLDGCFFSTAGVDTEGRIRFAFPFAPQTQPCEAVLRAGRDGEVRLGPLRLAFGTPGAAPSHAAPADALAGPAPEAERRVPFGTDCAAPEVAVVVPVYGAPQAVARCLDSVLAHTSGRARLIVIDDASPDAAISPLLARYAGIAGVRVLHNETNLGFTATANRGIVEAGRADVVLLNADTEVASGWLTGLRRAAYCANDVATATAVSDNAGAFSVPELEHENAMPATFSLEDTARALWQRAGLAYPELPSGNGFCLYIRRSVIDAIGLLDAAAFPQGYGEENDFCQRASARGMRHLIAGNVFVHHERSRSFGHERRLALGVTGMAILRERWPRYEADVAATLFSYERRVLDWRVRRIHAQARADRRPRARVLCTSPEARSRVHEIWRLMLDADRMRVEHDGVVMADCARDTRETEPVARRIHEWLQRFAIEAVVVGGSDSILIESAARPLGVPIRIADDIRDLDAAAADAIASARSFRTPTP